MLSLIIAVGIAVLLVSFWPYICSFLSRKVLPWIRQHMGEKFFEPFARIIEWLDGKIRCVRRGYKEFCRFIKERVLVQRVDVVRHPGGIFDGKRTVEVKKPNGEIEIIVESIPESELPEDIRKAMLTQMADKQGNRSATLDERQVVIEKIKKRIKEDLSDDQLEHTTEEKQEAEEMAQILEITA